MEFALKKRPVPTDRQENFYVHDSDKPSLYYNLLQVAHFEVTPSPYASINFDQFAGYMYDERRTNEGRSKQIWEDLMKHGHLKKEPVRHMSPGRPRSR